jgi:hypothetical protein
MVRTERALITYIHVRTDFHLFLIVLKQKQSDNCHKEYDHHRWREIRIENIINTLTILVQVIVFICQNNKEKKRYDQPKIRIDFE